MTMRTPREPGSPPDHRAALAQYRRRAGVYDLELALLEPVRRRAIAALALQPGETVVDAGCGTGLSLSALRTAVGARGRVIGIDQCPEMLAQARTRTRRWRNVTLIEATLASAPLGGHADAALFHFTHDILREPAALATVLGHLRPGARVVACGLQWASPWAWLLNFFVLGAALHSVSSLDGLSRPWSLLAERLDALQVDSMLGSSVFLTSGVVADPNR